MPRKSAKRDASTKAKDSEEVKVVEQEAPPRRSGRAATKSDSGEPDRSRRSSTVAQTTASATESKGTRGRNSPSEGRRSSRRDVNSESPPTRVRSARRSTSHINYKESDGEEEGSTPKNEDNFDSEEYGESDSDENAKHKAKKVSKSPSKGTKVGGKQKAKTSKAGPRGRGRPKKKGETILISDDSADDSSDSTYGEKKSKSSKDDDSKASRKRPKKSSTTESGGKAGRRSSVRGSGSKASPEPAARRPSRNKQIKKYTEVDEDFSDAKSEEEEEVEYEPEVKRETSRKRKREKTEETASVKKPKREKVEVKDESPEESSEPEEKTPRKAAEKKKSFKEESEDDEDSEEPMEIDDEDSNSPADKKKRSSKASEVDTQKKVVSPKKSSAEKKESDEEDSEDSKDEEETDEKDKTDRLEVKKKDLPVSKDEDTQHSKTSSQYSDEAEDSADENEETVPKITIKPSIAQSKPDEAMDLKTTSNCLDSKPETTFPPKDTVLETSMNGENDKLDSATAAPVNASPQTRNDLPPKQNGSHENDSFQRTDSHVRRYVANPSITEDLRSSLKDKTFGIASYNLQGCDAIRKDKLVQELGKLQASVICLQDVPQHLYRDALETSMDMLGFKGVWTWPKGVQHTALATFYKTSVFRLSKTTETPLQKLIEKDMESPNMEDDKEELLSKYLNKCGNVHFLHLSTVLGDRHLVVGNAELPSTNIGLQSMQVSCLSQEILTISEDMQEPVILCGELNMVENKIPYQLMRHGCLTEGMAEELKMKVDDSFAEVAAFERFLKKASARPSCKMSSCYATALGKELLVPSSDVTSSNLVWFTPDSLRTMGVLDLTGESSDHYSLKADLAFSV